MRKRVPCTRRHFTLGLAAAGALSLPESWPLVSEPAVAAEVTMPPVAPVEPKIFKKFGRKRRDNYDWLRDRSDPRVITYLHAENAYADARLQPIRPLIDELAAELKTRAVEQYASVPAVLNGYVYQRRFAKGAQYPLVARRKAGAAGEESAEEVVLDVATLAAAAHGQQYRLGAWAVSPDNARVAFAVDFTGGREFHIFVRTIATGAVEREGIAGAAANIVFAADSETLFYVRNEPGNLRSYQVWRHRIGSDVEHDVLVYEESDPTFSVSIYLSKSRKLILMDLDSERTSELRYLPADEPTGEFKMMEPRRRGLIYEVDHAGDRFFIRTNLDAPDFRLMTAPQANPGAAHWREIIAQQPGRYLSHFEAFETFVAVDVEDESGVAVRVLRLADAREIPVPRPAAIGVASTSFANDNEANIDAAATVLRFRFSGPLQPPSIYDLDVTTGALTLRRQDPAIGWFDPGRYRLDRISGTAPDGEAVPVTIVCRKDLRRSGDNPALIVGYGAYGLSLRPTFTSSVFSLIDRGFVYAIAHVRGGHEKGERWYEEGRMLNKRNTFLDFIAATEGLIDHGYADRHRVFAQGESAGGLLMGAIANLRPDLYAGIVAEAPFVDVITTMSDEAMPLTTLEYDEWGNPDVKREYDYMLSYSPYDNVGHEDYPAMFVTAGFYDTQVTYAEPAKWVARLRASKTNGSDLLFKTDMESGHSGRSGRLGSVEESAEIMGWLIAHARDGRLR